MTFEKNLSQYTDEKIQQLERICKLHQLTITRQRVQGKEMFRQLTDAKELVKRYEEEAKEAEEKVAVLEAHFIELNQAMDENSSRGDSHSENDDNLRSSIIKIDSAHVKSLKDRSIELQNQIKVLRKRNDELNEKVNIDNVLKAKVDELTLSLEAKTIEMERLAEVYESNKSSRRFSVGSKSAEMDISNDTYDLDDELTAEDLRQIVMRKDRMIKQLKQRMANLEDTLKTVRPGGAALTLRNARVQQEKHDAVFTRFTNLMNRMDDSSQATDEDLENEFMSPSKSFLISMSDKLSLLHDYQKISLQLLELRLSNEIESLESG